ncbi:MAG TPA: NAD-dependent epimerase/dehydratase family protein [Thermodesulfobacteriota bacterium]|nr:NAD-dependent epimerase/dehydratase family protein [Thermodesulfobacteriota bacterium]
MNILVTGVAGFIGSHLAERLLREGFQVIGVDSFLDYYPKKIKENNLKGLVDNNRFTFIESNIFELNLKEILKKVDAIFHQAAIPGVRASWGKEFNKYVENNILGTQVLLEACKDARISKFIYASSSSVYGDADELPIKETSATKPVSPYGVSKLDGEHLAVLYFKGYSIPTVSLRYFTVYGPRQRPDMGFHKFITAVLLGREIEIYGTGEQTRDFTFIGDAVEANLQALMKGKNGEVYNIGGGSRITLIEVIKIIEEIAGRKAILKYVEHQRGDVQHTYADISKAKRDFGYTPRVDIYEGLKRHYDWLKENLDIYR